MAQSKLFQAIKTLSKVQCQLATQRYNVRKGRTVRKLMGAEGWGKGRAKYEKLFAQGKIN